MSARSRRYWTVEQKRRIVAETKACGGAVAKVARRHDLNANLLFNWIKDPRFNDTGSDEPDFLPVAVSEESITDRDATNSFPEERRVFELAFGEFTVRFSEEISEASLRRIVMTLRSVQ